MIKKIFIVGEERSLSDLLATFKPERLGKPVSIGFVNAHAFNLCFKSADFLNHLMLCDYVFRDGSGMKILYKMLGDDPGLNLNGTDLIPRIIELYTGKEAALLGTEKFYLERAAAVISEKGVRPVLMVDGFQEDHVYLEAARKQPAALIILAMGMPKQERIAALLARELDYPCLIICGGAILDFIGGKVRRAPLIFRRFGMEWMYRLLQEPRRLFGRYVVGNAVFLVRGLNMALLPGKSLAAQRGGQ